MEPQQQVLPSIYPSFDCEGCDQSPSVIDQCSTCDQCESCCDCFECQSCDRNHRPDDQCSTCDYCRDCCTCWFCQGCEETRPEDNDQCSNCNECERCCDCWNCQGCRYTLRESEWRCDNCEACEDCCECSLCDSCDSRTSDYCRDCDRCEDCCNCGDAERIFTDGSLTFYDARKTEFKTNVSRRHISLELEIAKSENHSEIRDIAETWNDAIVSDGSLPSTGFEINTNPSQGDVFIRHIEQVCNELTRGNATVTTACGMHCHVSAKDFSYFDLFKLCRLYCKVEDGLFSCIAPSRRNNRYCERSKKTYAFSHYETFKQDLITALYGEYALGKGSKPSLRHHNGKKKLAPMCDKYNSARYNALNLHSFFYRGTIEFRHHQGTTNAYKATRWGMICASVLDAAQKMTLREIDALSDNGFDALLSVLPSDLRYWITERKQDFGYND